MKESIKSFLRPIKRTIEDAISYFRYVFTSERYECDSDYAFTRLKELSPPPNSTALTQNNIHPAEYDLTVIVPAYNAEKWVRECIDSILSQKTEYIYKIIAINDGSKDKTGEILDSYLPDPRIQVIHQENKGHSGARNVALRDIYSKYIMFVDSDDVLPIDAINKLLESAYANEADIVEGNGYRFDVSGHLGMIKTRIDDRWGGPCLKVMRSQLFGQVHFPEGYLYEDTIIGTLIFPLAKKVIMMPDEVYGYRIHSDSITQKHTAEPNRVHSFWIMLLMHQNMQDLGISVDYDSYISAMSHIVFTYRRCVMLSDEAKKLIFICTREFIISNFSEHLSKNNQYKYLENALLNFDFGKYCIFCETYRKK